MKTANFITLFNTRIRNCKELSAKEIVAIVSDLIKPTDYIKYDDKIKIVYGTIQKTRDADYPTPARYRQLILDLINVYTKLEVTTEDFDVLSANKLLDPIMATFQSEYVICESLFKMIQDDLLISGK